MIPATPVTVASSYDSRFSPASKHPHFVTFTTPKPVAK